MRKLLLILFTIFLITSPLQAGGNRWSSKPPISSQIDWGHPLSKGLVGCVLMNEGSGNILKDLVDKKNFISSGGVLPVVGKKGNGFNYPNTNCISTKSINPVPATLRSSIFVIAKPYNNNTTRKRVIRLWNITSGSLHVIDFSDGSASIRIFGSIQYGAGLFESTTDTVNYSANTDYILTSVWDNDGYLKLYRDGKLVNTSTNSRTSLLNSIDSSTIGVNTAGGGNNFSGIIYTVYYYNRALSPSEIQQLYQDPYCFIKPPTIWSNFSTAVATARRFFMFD